MHYRLITHRRKRMWSSGCDRGCPEPGKHYLHHIHLYCTSHMYLKTRIQPQTLSEYTINRCIRSVTTHTHTHTQLKWLSRTMRSSSNHTNYINRRRQSCLDTKIRVCATWLVHSSPIIPASWFVSCSNCTHTDKFELCNPFITRKKANRLLDAGIRYCNVLEWGNVFNFTQVLFRQQGGFLVATKRYTHRRHKHTPNPHNWVCERAFPQDSNTWAKQAHASTR